MTTPAAAQIARHASKLGLTVVSDGGDDFTVTTPEGARLLRVWVTRERHGAGAQSTVVNTYDPATGQATGVRTLIARAVAHLNRNAAPARTA